MTYLIRTLEQYLPPILERNKSILLLGPRQTGKTTLLNRIEASKRITLANPYDRLRYEKEPFILTKEIEYLADATGRTQPLVIIDEIQKVPILMDAAQDLIDRKVAKFILTGSSARKLKRHGNINLLPGRVIPLRLDPLTQPELTENIALQDFLLYGALPEIILEKNINDREQLLNAYVTIYLEEEIRAEALVRDIGHFARFLEFACAESGKIINFTKLSQEIGVTHSTISGYYQILEDCLVAERIEPLFVSKTRHKLSKSQKYLFYDLGVRRVAAREGTQLPNAYLGHLFEQYVGLELIRLLRLTQQRSTLKYWRDSDGPEIDWIIDKDQTYTPIEVKWTVNPTLKDAKHLQIFLNEYETAEKGYIVCRTPYPFKLTENITALPWSHLTEIIS